jgi:hypothetical protein
MTHRNPLLILLVGASCVMAEPIGNEPNSEGGAADSQDGDSGDGHTGMSSADDDASVSGTATMTGDTATASGTASVSDTATASGEDSDGAGEDTDPTVGDTDGSSLFEQCGVELPPPPECPDTFEARCGCDGCNLQWFVPDSATVNAIVEECVCLCEAAGCGVSASGGADAGSADEGCEDTGSGETSYGDTDIGTSSSATNAE